MMNIHCPEHLEAVRAFAREHDCAWALQDKLDYLEHYGGDLAICELHKDFAPHSFAFLMRYTNGARWFNGGLIYSGPGQPLDGSFPALTVSLAPTGREHQWSVHT